MVVIKVGCIDIHIDGVMGRGSIYMYIYIYIYIYTMLKGVSIWFSSLGAVKWTPDMS